MLNLRSSLAAKWLIIQILGFGIILSVVGAYQYRILCENAYADVENTGETVSQSFKEMLAENPDLFNSQTLQPVLFRLSMKIADIQHISVLNKSHEIIADSGNDNKLKGVPIDENIIGELLRSGGKSKSLYTFNEENFLRLSNPIEGRYDPLRRSSIVGILVIDMALTAKEAEINATFTKTMWAVSVLLFLFWIVQYIFARRGFLQGLKRLAFTAELFSKGDLSARILVKTEDELGQLGRSFNRMASEMQQTNTAIRQSEERNSELIENANGIIFTIDLTGKFTSLNRVGERLTGFTLAEVLQMNLSNVISPKDIDNVRARMAKIAKGEKLPNFELEISGKNGIKLILDINSRLILQDSTPIGIQGIGRDITERRRIEEALIARELRLKEAQAIAHLGSWEWDIINNEIAWSDELYRVFGLEPQQFAGTYEAFLERIHPGDRELVGSLIANSLSTHKMLDFDSRIVLPDGTLRYMRSNGYVTLGENGTPIRMTGTGQDVTESKRIEEELEQTRDAALESTRLKSEFLANMSHEIRTPMNGIIGMTQLTLGTELNSEQREYLEMVEQAGESLLGVINDILDYSKIEANKIELEKIDFDLSEVFSNCLKPLTLRAGQKALELTSEISPDVPKEFEGDPNRLRQILVNLVSNAIKFTETGKIEISVTKKSEKSDKVELHFQVRDTGIGVPAEKQSSIFEAFAQADGTTTRKYGGTGLGLAITTQLVELMGGRVWIESPAQTVSNTENPGSTFHFTVWLKQNTTSTANNSLPILTKIMNKKIYQTGLRILLAEDNHINQHLAVNLLKKYEHIVKLVVNGKDAVEAFHNEAFDIILMDVQMPIMDGFEATRLILDSEKSSGQAHTPIIAMTAHAMKGDRERCLDAGMDDYIAKPILADELFQIIDRLSDPAGTETVEEDDSTAGSKIDLSTFLDSTDGDIQLTLELIEIFFIDTPAKMSAIQKAIDENDGQALSRAAHAFMSSTGYFPQSKAGDVLKDLEIMGRNDRFAKSAETYAELSREVGQITSSLKAYANAVELKS